MIKDSFTEEEALKRAAAKCSVTEHCRMDVRDRLLKWGMHGEAVERILNRLTEEKFIDEERYCRAFIHDKFRFSKWGKNKIAQALSYKKIPWDCWHKLLDEIDEEEYLATLRSLLESKRKSVRAKDDYELNGKLMRFAVSRGFEMCDIRRCIRLPEEEAEGY